MLKRLLVVPLCFVAGLLLMVFIIIILAHELRGHPTGYRNTSDAGRIFLIIVALTHRFAIVSVASVMAIGWAAMWWIALLVAFERLSR
jgi:hypothetical protein